MNGAFYRNITYESSFFYGPWLPAMFDVTLGVSNPAKSQDLRRTKAHGKLYVAPEENKNTAGNLRSVPTRPEISVKHYQNPIYRRYNLMYKQS